MTLGDLPVGSLVRDPGTRYYGQPIVWRCVDKNHEGYPENSVTLQSDNILCVKCFDAMEPQNTDGNRGQNGNSRYSVSNILQWMNSDADAGQWYSAQHSADAPPDTANVNNGFNPYNTEAGFLSRFSESMRNALLNTTVTVARNTITDGGGSEQVTSKIFLASATEVGLAEENSITEGTLLAGYSGSNSRLAYPTAEAVKNSDYVHNNFNTGAPYIWWLRTPRLSVSHYVGYVSLSDTFSSAQAYLSSLGFRPLCNVPKENVVSENPDSEGIYTIQWPLYSGKTLGELPTGTIVKIRENGVLANFKVAQHNYNQSGVTAIERDLCLADTVAFNEDVDNTYEGGTLDTFLAGDYRNRLDQDVRDALVTVNIPVTAGSGNYNATTISRSVFVFSGTENGLEAGELPIEGSKVDIYNDNTSRIKHSDDDPTTACTRWTRSSSMHFTNTYVWSVLTTGGEAHGNPTFASYLAPVLTLPSNAQISDEGIIDGTCRPTATGKPFYFGISNTPHKVNDVYVGMENTPHRITKGYVGDESKVPRLFYSNGPELFADYSWAEIKEIADAGLAQEYFNVGDEKPITLSDGSENVVQIAGFYHDANLSGTFTAPITLCLKYLLPNAIQMNSTETNVGGFFSSALAIWLHTSDADGFKASLLPDEIKNVYRPVQKISSAGNQSNDLVPATRQIFIPSEIEVFGTSTLSTPGEGLQYPIFKSESGKVRSMYGKSNNHPWWLRSPTIRGTMNYCRVSSTGTLDSLGALNLSGILPMFCI